MYKMQVLSRTPSPKPPAMGKKLGVNSQPFPTPSPNSPVPPMNGINHKSKPIATGYSPGFQKVRTLRMNFPVSLSKEGSVRQGLFLMRMTLKMTHQKSYWNVGSQQGWASHSLQAKSNSELVSRGLMGGRPTCLLLCCLWELFLLPQLSWAVLTGTVWPAKSEIVTGWPFKAVCPLLALSTFLLQYSFYNYVQNS